MRHFCPLERNGHRLSNRVAGNRVRPRLALGDRATPSRRLHRRPPCRQNDTALSTHPAATTCRRVPLEDIVYLNFFDDRLRSLNGDSIGLVSEAYYSLFPEKKGAKKVFFFLDEPQSVAGWEAYVERLLRTDNCEVFLSGSSARLLSSEIATQMCGRSLSWELFPFSFSEFVRARGIDPDGPPTSKLRLSLGKQFDDYWQTGGFPEVLDVSAKIRVMIYQEYLNAMLFRDVIECHDIAHPGPPPISPPGCSTTPPPPIRLIA